MAVNIVCCIFASVWVFSSIDSLPAMIRVPLNMGRSAANYQGIVRDFHSVFRVVTLYTNMTVRDVRTADVSMCDVDPQNILDPWTDSGSFTQKSCDKN